MTKSFAVVDITAIIHDTVILEPFSTVMAGARIGAHTRIGSHSVVGPHVIVGADCCIHHNVSLTNCEIGDGCILHNGSCIGQDGFGFEIDPQSGEVRKKPQDLRVVLGQQVEVGANTCIDRGSWRDTQIADGVKLDNLVQIGHNVQIGSNSFICGQCGIAGSTSIGSHCRFGGRSGAVDHLQVGDRVDVAVNSILTKNAKSRETYAGFPAMPMREWRRLQIHLRQVSRRTSMKVDDLDNSRRVTDDSDKHNADDGGDDDSDCDTQLGRT